VCTQIPNPPRVEISRPSWDVSSFFRFVFRSVLTVHDSRFEPGGAFSVLRLIPFRQSLYVLDQELVQAQVRSPKTSNYDFQFWIPSKRGWSRFVRRRYRSVRSWIRGFVFRVVDFTPIDRASLASRRSLRFGLTRGRGIFFENHPSVSRQKSNRIGLLLIVCPPGERRKVWGRGVYRRVR